MKSATSTHVNLKIQVRATCTSQYFAHCTYIPEHHAARSAPLLLYSDIIQKLKAFRATNYGG